MRWLSANIAAQQRCKRGGFVGFGSFCRSRASSGLCVEWLKRTVAESLADPRPPVPHEEAMARARATLERAKRRNKAR